MKDYCCPLNCDSLCVLDMMTVRWMLAIEIHFTPSQPVSILISSPVHKIDANNIASWFLSASLDVRAVTRGSRSVVRRLCLSCAHSFKRGHSNNGETVESLQLPAGGGGGAGGVKAVCRICCLLAP
jgi:hypothetical protein